MFNLFLGLISSLHWMYKIQEDPDIIEHENWQLVWPSNMKWTQMVARTVLDTLRQVSENTTDVGTVFEIVSRLAQDVGK